MRRHAGRTLALGSVGLLMAAALFLRTEYAGERVCALARQRLPEVLGLEVELGKCTIDPLRGGIELSQIRLRNPEQKVPLFAADRLLVRLGAVDVLARRIRLERLEADRPSIHLDLSAPAGQAEKRREGCPLEALQKVELERVLLVGSSISIALPQGRTLEFEELDADARLTSSVYSARLSIPRGAVETGRVRIPVSRIRFAGDLDVEEQRLVVGSAEVSAGDFSLFVRGEVESLCEPRPNLEASFNLPLDLVEAALGEQAPALSGNAAVVLRLEGSLDAPAVEAEVTLSRATVDDFEVGDAYLVARLERENIFVDRLDLTIGEHSAKARGSIGLRDGFPVKAEVELEEVEFARILDKVGLDHAWVNFEGSGRIEVEGKLVPFQLTGPLAIDVRNFRVYDRGFDRPKPETMLQFDWARVELTADLNAERARLLRGRIRTDRSDIDADATLNFDLERGLDIDVALHDLDLGDLGHVVQLPWAGTVEGNAKIKGPYGARIGIEGAIKGRDVRFHKLNLGSVEAQVRFNQMVLGFPSINLTKGRSRFWAEGELDLGVDGGPEARGRGSFDGARLSDLVAIIGDEHWIFDLLRGRAEARINGQATVEGRVLAPHALIDVSLFDATYFDRQLGSGALAFRAQDGEVVAIDRLDFDGPCGQLAFSGQVLLSEGLDFRISAPLLFMKELAKPDAEWLETAGTLSAKARLFGPFDHVRMDGSVDARDIALFGVSLGSGVLALGLDRTNLWLKGPLGTDLLLDTRMIVEGELPFAAGVSLATTDLGHYVQQVEGLRGSLAGEALATGTIERYRETRGDVWISALDAEKDDQTYQAHGPIEIGFDGTAVELRTLSLKGSNALKLTASGFKSGGGELDFTVDGSFDARLLESFTPWIEQAGGRVRASATITGPSDSPTFVGAAELRGGRFIVPGWPVSVRDLEGSVEFSQNKLFVSDVQGSFNNGRALLRGEIGMKEFSPQRLDLGLLVDQVHFRWPEHVPTTFSGELRLYGLMDDLVLSGDLDLTRLRYAQDIDLEGMLKDLNSKSADSYGFEKQEEFLRYDVSVHVPGDARIENNLAKVSLKGDLKVVGTNLNLGVLGTLTADEGGRAFFRGNEFSLTRVSVDLTERDRIAPVIDVHGESQVRDYKVYVHAYGPAADPEVDLTSEPELARSDLVTLLTLGYTSRDPAMNTAGAGAGLVGETLFNIAGLDKQVKRFVPNNTILRDFNFHISTQYSEVSGMVEPTAQLESKFLTDSLKLRLSQPVISGRGRRAQAEYRFNDHVSAQAQWDNESSESSFGDLGLDLKLRWERE